MKSQDNNCFVKLDNKDIIHFFFNYFKDHTFFKCKNIATDYINHSLGNYDMYNSEHRKILFKTIYLIIPLIQKAIHFGYLKKYSAHLFKKTKEIDLKVKIFINLFQSSKERVISFIKDKPDATTQDLYEKFPEYSKSTLNLKKSYYFKSEIN